MWCLSKILIFAPTNSIVWFHGGRFCENAPWYDYDQGIIFIETTTKVECSVETQMSIHNFILHHDFLMNTEAKIYFKKFWPMYNFHIKYNSEWNVTTRYRYSHVQAPLHNSLMNNETEIPLDKIVTRYTFHENHDNWLRYRNTTQTFMSTCPTKQFLDEHWDVINSWLMHTFYTKYD